MKKKYPDQSYLQQIFTYDPDTGELRWRERTDIPEPDCKRWNKKYAGRIVGCLDHRGYRLATVGWVTYYVHRLIWKLVTGKEPDKVLDHRNCDPSDNRFCNLREATWHQNAQNRKPMKNKKSELPKGISFNRDNKDRVKYQVSVRNGGKKNAYIGCYKTLSEAQRSYRIHARRLFGEYARHS